MILSEKKINEKLIIIILLSSGVFQVIGLLRAATIFNTAYIVIVFNVLISSLITVLILFSLKNLRFNLITSTLLIITIASILFGFFYNGMSRYFFSDTYNMLFFILFIVYLYSVDLTEMKLEKSMKFVAILFFISMILSFILPLVGVPLVSVGKASIAMTLPFFYFLFKGNKKWAASIFIFLIIASKRGVILSLFGTLLIYIMFTKKISFKIKFLSTSFLVGVICLGLYLSMNPQMVFSLPSFMQPLFYKLMLINPFSSYNQISEDYRVFEAISSIKNMTENPLLLFSGYGPGFSYNVENFYNELINTNVHNTHFTPFSLLIKGGIAYTLLIGLMILNGIIKGFKNIRTLNTTQKAFFLYLIASVFNSLTAFTLYIDYLFIISIGVIISFQNKSKSEVKI